MNDRDEDKGQPPAESVRWDIQRTGRAWGSEAMDRYQLTPEKFEMYRGKLFWSDNERLLLLGLLLENVGADAAVRLGDPEVWREAIATLAMSGPYVDMALSNVHARETRHESRVRLSETAILTWIPAGLLEAAGIKPERQRELERPDGRIITRSSAPAILSVEGRETIEDVIVCEEGDEAVLGWHALSGLNLRLDRATGRLVDRGPIPAAASGRAEVGELQIPRFARDDPWGLRSVP